jgi:hypothetical protein
MQSFGRELARNRIARAFAISLLLHFVGISGVELGSRLGLWQVSLLPSGKARIVAETKKAEQQLQEAIEQALQQQVPEAQLVFVEVDPTQAAPEPPKNTKYYSSENTAASNPTPNEKEQPKIDGRQDKIPKPFDTLKPSAPEPVEPPREEPKPQTKPETPEQKPLPERPREELKPTREQQPGETLLARAAPRPEPQQPPVQPPKRPRTLAEAKIQKGIIEGLKSQQEGGVRKQSLGTNLDVARSPFGSYDALFIQAVQARWFNLLDEREFVGGQAGKVVLEFRLNHDGRITALRVVESEVDEILSWLCQRAILDPAPYRAFPSDLRRMLNHDYREVRFTFYYNQ